MIRKPTARAHNLGYSTFSAFIRSVMCGAAIILVGTSARTPMQLGFRDVSAANLAFAKRVIDSARGGDVKIVADIDGDGYKDLIIGGMPGEDLRWHRYPSWTKTTIAVPISQFHTDGEAGDVDGDGDFDIVVPDDAGIDRLQWFENPLVRPGGPGNPADGSQWTKHVIASTDAWGKDVELSDFDADGSLDVGVRFPFEHVIYFQSSPNVWSRRALPVNHAGLEGMDSGDVDRDGDTDLIVEGGWLRNPGGAAARNPASWTRFAIGATPEEFKAVVANIDGDSANEVIFSSSESQADVVAWDPVNGDPTGSWVSRVIAPMVQGAHTLQTADMDNDGHVDVIVGQMHTSSNREIAVYLNVTGNGQSWQKYLVDQGTGIHNGIVADIGNDGDFDIFGANWAGNPPVALWENLIGAGSDTTPPSMPAGVSATAVSSTQVNLSWTASTDNVGVAGYRVFRNGTAIATPTTTSYADAGLAPSTTYSYRVSARDAAGNESAQSAPVSATTATPTDTTPPVVASVAADTITSTGARITWTTNESATSRVDYGPTTAYGSTASVSGLRTAHAVTLTGLQPATTYHYRATSLDAAGNQGSSSDFTFTTQSTSTPSNLIAHWPLEDGSGTTVSDVVGSNHGTLVNGSWSPGQTGTGISFNGTNSYIALPSMDVAGTGLTIAIWVKSSSFSGSVDQRFVAKSADTAEQSHYWLVGQTNNGQNRLRFRLKTNGTTTTLIAGSGDLPLNTWYHVAATYDGAAMRLYLDGSEVGMMPKSGALDVSGAVPLNIGRSPDGTNYMHGSIDDVRIYGRALSATEITTLMSADPTPPSTPAGVSATAVSTTQVNLSWAASTDNVGVAGYRVFRNGTAIATPTTTSYADMGLAPSTTYSYRVSARDAAGNESAQSAPVSATTATPDTTPPVITSVAADTITSTGARITWTTNESATSRVDYGPTTAYGNTASVSGLRTAHAVTLTGLQPATTYHYRATSRDAAGNQGSSSDLTFTTQPPPTGPDLIGHWRLDEGAGAAAADAAGSYPGTLVGGASWVAGQRGMAVAFDGTDDYIALPSIEVSGTAMTIAAWVKSSSFPLDVDQRFISKSTDSAEQSHYWMLSLTNVGQNRLRFRLKAGGTTTTLVATSGTLPLDTWYHVAATYDGTAMRLFLNGTEVGTIGKSGTLAAGSGVPVDIGRSPDASNYLVGAIDDVRIYRRALSASEIGVIMTGP